MKTNESVLHKGMRTIVQAALRREASEPCITCWSYQPHRPEKPLPEQFAPAASSMRRAFSFEA